MASEFQERLYQYISGYLATQGRSPSYAELTAAMGISPRSKSLITRSLRALNQAGHIHIQKEGRRLVISLRPRRLPIIGSISAGSPIEAIPDDQSLDLEALLHAENRFALRVKGDSMIGDGIFDGDIILCRQADRAHEGDIVVALIDQHHVTLKRISYKLKGMVTLIPSHQALKPHAYSPDRIHIQGIYVGLIRLHP